MEENVWKFSLCEILNGNYRRHVFSTQELETINLVPVKGKLTSEVSTRQGYQTHLKSLRTEAYENLSLQGSIYLVPTHNMKIFKRQNELQRKKPFEQLPNREWASPPSNLLAFWKDLLAHRTTGVFLSDVHEEALEFVCYFSPAPFLLFSFVLLWWQTILNAEATVFIVIRLSHIKTMTIIFTIESLEMFN